MFIKRTKLFITLLLLTTFISSSFQFTVIAASTDGAMVRPSMLEPEYSAQGSEYLQDISELDEPKDESSSELGELTDERSPESDELTDEGSPGLEHFEEPEQKPDVDYGNGYIDELSEQEGSEYVVAPEFTSLDFLLQLPGLQLIIGTDTILHIHEVHGALTLHGPGVINPHQEVRA